MTRRYSAETNEDFLHILKKWVKIEDATISMSGSLLKKVENPVISCIIDTVKKDSQKHKEVLNMILEGLEGTLTLTPHDMATLSEFIDKHTQIEKDAVDIANMALTKVRTPIAKFLLTYLCEDEKKHDLIMENLNTIKAQAMNPS